MPPRAAPAEVSDGIRRDYLLWQARRVHDG